MKKKLLVIALAAIMLALAGYATVAAFTADTNSTNTVVMGKIDIAIVETTALAGGGEADYPAEPVKVMPATEVSKIVRVTNVDANDCYVRAKVDIEVKGVELSEEELADVLSKITVGYGTGWQKKAEDDGYYYCAAKLAANAQSEPLMTTVAFSKDIGNNMQNATVEVKILAQAVQSANNGASALDAAGWPAD